MLNLLVCEWVGAQNVVIFPSPKPGYPLCDNCTHYKLSHTATPPPVVNLMHVTYTQTNALIHSLYIAFKLWIYSLAYILHSILVPLSAVILPV